MKLGLVRVATAQTKDICKVPFQIAVSFVDKIDDTIINDCSFFECEQFVSYVSCEKPQRLVLSCNSQEQLDYLLSVIKDYAVSLNLKLKRNVCFDLSGLANITNLESIQFYSNQKISKLWNLRSNTKLKHFEMIDYNAITDFSVFENSSVQDLRLIGCNYLSSFTSKLHIDDFGFLLKMPQLTSLSFDIVKDKTDGYYLNVLSKMTKLDCLYIPDSFFTFQQFAWLSSKLPQVKRGLDACVYCEGTESYSVIGARKPKCLKNKARVDAYREEYQILKNKYQSQVCPPNSGDID